MNLRQKNPTNSADTPFKALRKLRSFGINVLRVGRASCVMRIVCQFGFKQRAQGIKRPSVLVRLHDMSPVPSVSQPHASNCRTSASVTISVIGSAGEGSKPRAR
jgi:hypothetical protein